MMRRISVVLGALLVAAVVLPAVAEAQDTCFQPAGFGNQFRLRFTPVAGTPTRFVVTGTENVFADRAVTGSAFRGVNNPGTLRIGMTLHAVTDTASDIHYNIVVSLTSPFPGSYNAWRDALGDRLSGAWNMISCTGVPLKSGPDMVGN